MNKKESKSSTGTQNRNNNWDGRIGPKMQSVVRLVHENPYPSRYPLALAVGPHRSWKYGYETIRRCRQRDLIKIVSDHNQSEPRGDGAVVLTDKGRQYFNEVLQE